MSRMPMLSWREVEAVLKRAGFGLIDKKVAILLYHPRLTARVILPGIKR